MLDSNPNVDTTFCNPYHLGHVPQWRKNSKAQGWFRAWSDENWLDESTYGKYNLFLGPNKLYLENKDHGNRMACVHASCMRMMCMCVHAKVLETM